MDGWASLAGQLAQIGLPALGGLFGGPLGATIGGLVGKGVAAVLGVEPTPQAVQAAIAADPNGASLKLQALEEETKQRADELADIQNARATTVQLVSAGSNIAWGAPVISVIVTAGFFVIMFLLFSVRAEMPSSVFNLITVMLGVLASGFGSVIQFWIGSSESSRRNADVVRDVARNASTPSPGRLAEKAMDVAKRR